MKGNNELRINQETMIEAMQLYVTEKLGLKKTNVSDVRCDNTPYPEFYTIELSEAEEPKP